MKKGREGQITRLYLARLHSRAHQEFLEIHRQVQLVKAIQAGYQHLLNIKINHGITFLIKKEVEIVVRHLVVVLEANPETSHH